VPDVGSEILAQTARASGASVMRRLSNLIRHRLKGHALLGPVLVGQELARAHRVFDKRRFHRLEPKRLIDQA